MTAENLCTLLYFRSYDKQPRGAREKSETAVKVPCGTRHSTVRKRADSARASLLE